MCLVQAQQQRRMTTAQSVIYLQLAEVERRNDEPLAKGFDLR